MNNLKLDKPIVFFDLETTGVDTGKDQICQFSFVKISPDGEITKYTKLVKPSIPIPQVTTDVHGITNEMVKDEDPFSFYITRILSSIANCYLSGYNIRRFDIPLLAAEAERAGHKEHGLYDMEIIDVYPLYNEYRSHKLIAAVLDLCGRDLEDAHDAEADVMGTIDVLDALASKWEIDDPAELVKKSTPEGFADFAGKLALDDDGNVIYAIGKDKGKRLKDEPGFAYWMLNKDFPEETKNVIRKELKIAT